jgi:hypothetical protein
MDDSVIRICIGYDPKESVAWHTLSHSILSRSSRPVAFVPINLKNLTDCYARARDPKQSNEFSFSRFLVPFLCGYQGHALYLDCDMLFRCDIAELWGVINSQPGKAVYVVKHDYQPTASTKYLNNIQYSYPRKNWSSVVLWDCAHASNKVVTPEYVNRASPMELHRFMWLDDSDLGDLDIRWNWLVGEYQCPPEDVKNVHWTLGGPYFEEYSNSDFAAEWFSKRNDMNYCEQILEVKSAT